jgi:DNA-binding transcriptional ArsR family regulator
MSRRIEPEQAAPVFAALGDLTRLALLDRLSDGSRQSLKQVSANLAQTRQSITKHLKILEGAGLVVRRRMGRETHFELRSDGVADANAYLESISAQWDGKFARLKSILDE